MTTPSTAAMAARLVDLAPRLRARIHDFDGPALLDLLDEYGVRPEDIELRAHVALGPQPSLFHDIEIATAGGRTRVLITANLGLLSCRSPLPSYFRALLYDIDLSEPLMELLRVLDARLVAHRLAATRPARSFPEWPGLTHHLLRLSGPRSAATLASLFRAVFPELEVSARRQSGSQEVFRPRVRIGYTALGSCVFGDRAVVPVDGLEVILRCPHPENDDGEPWRQEVRQRLERLLFPILGEMRVRLRVVLLLLDRDSYAQFDGHSYVGYDPLRGGPWKPRRIVLFEGRVPTPEERAVGKAGPRGSGAAEVGPGEFAGGTGEEV
ncbi:hypothetical protein [Haliangium sp.]|uniref:hypothetical protein n=1 Tax=Haliangium sp. TaxID=2663208 RepID=UPI003D14620B